MQTRDLDRELQQQRQRESQRQHGEGIRTRCRDRGEGEDPEDQSAPPLLEPFVREHSDNVEHDDQQWKLETDPEHQQQVDQEPEVAVAGKRGDLDVAADGQQEVQGLGQDHVGQYRTGHEQRRGRHHERNGEPTLVAIETRGDEGPELVEPDRTGQHDTGGQADLEAQHELIERRGGQQPTPAVGADVRTRRVRQRAIGTAQQLAQAFHAEDPVAVPEKAHDRGQRDRRHRNQQAGPQLPDMLDEGHGPVRIGASTSLPRVQPGQK